MYLIVHNDKCNGKNIKKTDCIHFFVNTQIITEMWVGFSSPRRAEKGHEGLFEPFEKPQDPQTNSPD